MYFFIAHFYLTYLSYRDKSTLYVFLQMKKEIKGVQNEKDNIALVAALSLTLGTTGAITGCGSKSDSTSKTSTASTASAVAYQYIPAADGLKVTDSHILDVR